MTIPLYTTEAELANNSNTGLWYNKFCNQWHNWSLKSYPEQNAGRSVIINPKMNWIDRVLSEKHGALSLIEETVTRREKMITALKGNVFYLSTRTPFVTGLGNPHPVENGFCWHHLLGTPFLPASSIKGLVRDWVENWAHKEDPDIPKVFGTQSRECNTGEIIFLDAIPTGQVQLKAEIMTPHYGEYYTGDPSGAAVTPGDWLSPNPIPFLSVDIDQEFQFGMMSRTPDANKYLHKVVNWLREALETLGAGGKTAVSYGLFSESAERQKIRVRQDTLVKKKRQQQKKLEKISCDADKKGYSGIAKKVFIQAASEQWQTDNAKLYTGSEYWLPQIEEENNQGVRQQAVELLAGLLDRGNNKGIMSDPNKKTGKRQKNKFKERATKIAEKLIELKEGMEGMVDGQ